MFSFYCFNFIFTIFVYIRVISFTISLLAESKLKFETKFRKNFKPGEFPRRFPMRNIAIRNNITRYRRKYALNWYVVVAVAIINDTRSLCFYQDYSIFISFDEELNKKHDIMWTNKRFRLWKSSDNKPWILVNFTLNEIYFAIQLRGIDCYYYYYYFMWMCSNNLIYLFIWFRARDFKHLKSSK